MITLPHRARGRPTAAKKAQYEADNESFAIALEKIESSLDIRVSSRGWCYILEEHGLGKGDFSLAQELINDLRKSGRLPIDFVTEDDARRATQSDGEPATGYDPETWAAFRVDEIIDDFDSAEEVARDQLSISGFVAVGYWDWQRFYVEIAVEKIDLRTLFEPVCRKFNIRITNSKGWADIHSRAAMLKRMAVHAAAGRTPVLLLCGDHDPVGLQITDSIRRNLADLSGARYRDSEPVDLDVGQIVIERFGLNADFIDAHSLSWIDGLETGSGLDLADPQHRDHQKPHVQRYLEEFGPRKCEANALVVRPDAARQLCRRAIEQFIDIEAEARRREHNLEASDRTVELMHKIASDRGFDIGGAAS